MIYTIIDVQFLSLLSYEIFTVIKRLNQYLSSHSIISMVLLLALISFLAGIVTLITIHWTMDSLQAQRFQLQSKQKQTDHTLLFIRQWKKMLAFQFEALIAGESIKNQDNHLTQILSNNPVGHFDSTLFPVKFKLSLQTIILELQGLNIVVQSWHKEYRSNNQTIKKSMMKPS